MLRILAASCLAQKVGHHFRRIVAMHPIILESNLSSCTNGSDKPIKKTYNTPHPPKDPPENFNPLVVDHEAFEVPDFIPAAVFRPFSSKTEVLGPGADKKKFYKNPEYYSYHRYSFVALQSLCLKLREQRKEEGNIRCLYDKEDSENEKYDSDENEK